MTPTKIDTASALLAEATFSNPELVGYRSAPCGCAVGTLYDPAGEDHSVAVVCPDHDVPIGMTCEECGEPSEDVGFYRDGSDCGPGSAYLCARCLDREIHPRDYYDGPDRYDEDGEGRRF